MNIKFLGTSNSLERASTLAGGKFALAGLVFDLEIRVQFPDNLDIAVDIQVGRGVLMGIEPEDQDILAILVAAEIIKGLDHARQGPPAHENHGPNIGNFGDLFFDIQTPE